jgi:O-antigen ligase
MNRLLLATSTVALYLLHQDVWFWRDARPLIFGVLPIGLAYHALYCVAVTGLMWALTRLAWPSHLESAASDTTQGRRR